MDAGKKRLTLDLPAKYQIKVPGELDASWSEWVEEIYVSVEGDDKDLPVTILNGHFDQAALHGLLRRLYSLGIPLISVVDLEFS